MQSRRKAPRNAPKDPPLKQKRAPKPNPEVDIKEGVNDLMNLPIELIRAELIKRHYYPAIVDALPRNQLVSMLRESAQQSTSSSSWSGFRNRYFYGAFGSYFDNKKTIFDADVELPSRNIEEDNETPNDNAQPGEFNPLLFRETNPDPVVPPPFMPLQLSNKSTRGKCIVAINQTNSFNFAMQMAPRPPVFQAPQQAVVIPSTVKVKESLPNGLPIEYNAKLLSMGIAQATIDEQPGMQIAAITSAFEKGKRPSAIVKEFFKLAILPQTEEVQKLPRKKVTKKKQHIVVPELTSTDDEHEEPESEKDFENEDDPADMRFDF